jgi:hypothetical protein
MEFSYYGFFYKWHLICLRLIAKDSAPLHGDYNSKKHNRRTMVKEGDKT